jgi:acetyltransferase-like isoleucine patch superfamily enzyme
MSKIRLILAVIISIVPLSMIRIMLYRLFFRYDIRSSKIGFGTIIAIDNLSIDHVCIGNFNLFTGPFSFSAKNGCTIGGGNIFRCGKWASSVQFANRHFGRNIQLDENITITNKHYFDTVGTTKIGSGSWIAGYASQFWTHGGDKADIDINIGQNCYLASSVRFAPGSCIADDTIVGIGSVVTKKFVEPKTLIAGNPAIVKKTNYSWQNDLR